MSPYRSIWRDPHAVRDLNVRARELMAAAWYCAALLVAVGVAVVLSDCSSPPAGYPSLDVVALYASQEQTCVAAASTRTSAQECIAATRLAFCAKYPALAMCATDGGSHGD